MNQSIKYIYFRYQLAMHLLGFQDVIEQIQKDLFPHKLCSYLYNLSNKLNNFYRDCRVIGSHIFFFLIVVYLIKLPEQNDRILLCCATAEIMKKSLNLLGIIPLEQI